VVWTTNSGFERAVLGHRSARVARRLLPGSAGAYEPTVAVDRRGDRLYAWISGGVVCEACAVAARETPRGALTRPQILSSTRTSDQADLAQAAITPGRRSTVVWMETAPGNQGVVEATSAAWGHRFIAPQTLSPRGSEAILGGGGGGSRGIGVAGSGRVSAIWVEVPPGGTAGGPSRVRVATTGPSGRFDPARTLQHAHGVFTYERPAIAVAPGGRILATWTRYSDPGESQRGVGVWGAVSAGGHGGFQAPIRLSGVNGDASAVAATTSAGAGVAIFSASASGAGAVDSSLWMP
jgi:hypothetical protein